MWQLLTDSVICRRVQVVESWGISWEGSPAMSVFSIPALICWSKTTCQTSRFLLELTIRVLSLQRLFAVTQNRLLNHSHYATAMEQDADLQAVRFKRTFWKLVKVNLAVSVWHPCSSYIGRMENSAEGISLRLKVEKIYRALGTLKNLLLLWGKYGSLSSFPCFLHTKQNTNIWGSTYWFSAQLFFHWL